jgi:hypothetical protein
MITKTILAATALVLSVSAGGAFAGEGNSDPFPFQANAQITTGPAFMADTGSSAYPRLTGNSVQPSSLVQIEPAPGSEAPIQTALSLPRGAGKGTVAYSQTRSLNRYLATRSERGRYLEVGNARPGS